MNLSSSRPLKFSLLSSGPSLLLILASEILELTDSPRKFSAESSKTPNTKIQPFLALIANLVQGSSVNGRDVAVQCLESLLPKQELRIVVWQIPGVIAG